MERLHQHLRGWWVQGGRGGSNESERFGDEPSAEAFEKLGDAHSQQRPYG
ncbi:hypothetical protein AB0D98_31045 [Streptomyces sp. NPDC047987]